MRPLTFDTVLAATDLSDGDIPAVSTAIELSHLAGAQLHVVHARTKNGRVEQALDRHLRAADRDARVLPGTIILEGSPADIIVQTARATDADVIVLGPHRPEHTRSAGGTAYRVVATSERQCLVLPGRMELPLGRILVAIDSSPAARGVLAVAMTWASALRRRNPPQPADATELVILHVETPAEEVNIPAHEVMDRAVSAVSERVAPMAGVSVRRVSDRAADVAQAILDRTTSERFDLIVLGTRARIGSVPELGSVSSAVVQSTSCPLLLVPPRTWLERALEPEL